MAYARLQKIDNCLAQLERMYDVNLTPDINFSRLCAKINDVHAVEYDPYNNSKVATFETFHNDSSQIKLLLGPFGSGKSTACCQEIVRRSCLLPAMQDGVRRSKWAIIRNTMGELESTTLATWLQWFGNLGEYKRTKKPLLSYTYNFNDNFGKVEMEIIFIGLDREDDKQKLESLELTGAYMNELQHIAHGIFVHVFGRLGRYPAKIHGKIPKILIADTNPPDQDHWIYEHFEKNPPKNTKIFHQPPGLILDDKKNWINNPYCDNAKHLDENYYYDMACTNHFAEEYIKVYCRGEYGIVIPGKKVFPEYNDDLHSVETVEIIEDLPVLLCWDFGTTPCCLLMQFTRRGQMRCFKEFCTDFSSVKSLAENFIKPYLNGKLYGMEWISIGDPSGIARGQNFGVSTFDVLGDAGIASIAAKTNDIQARIESVRSFLNKMVNGQPGVIISRTECPTLRKALAGKYCYKRIKIIGDEKYRDLPDKNHPWSDIADAIEYGALEFMGEGMRIEEEREMDWKEYKHEYTDGQSEVGGY